MARRLKVRAVKRRELDEDKLALAFLMLAKLLREESEEAERKSDEESSS